MDIKEIPIKIVFNYYSFLIGFLLLNKAEHKAVDGFLVDYKENSELIQKPIGHNVTLECNLNGVLDTNQIAGITYHWYFKQCGESSSGALNCYDTKDNEDWMQLPCEKKDCKSELHLTNVTEKYSGLYKCTVMPKIGNTLDVKLVRKFQLDIKSSSPKIPEFLDGNPVNKTTNKGSQAIFECRIYSEEYPTIKWFRRLTNLRNSTHENIHTLVYYNGQAYELLTSTRERATSGNVYLSKLFLNEVIPDDEGCYACVAITFHGHNIREAYLKVNEPLNDDDDSKDYWSDYEEENVELATNPKEFWLLFLMPVGLAFLPLTLWLCYILLKRYSLKNEIQYLEENDQQCMLKS